MADEKTANHVVQYEVDGQEVKLSMNIIKKYLVSGNAENISDQELVMFLNLCQYSKLNPWLKEAYCIKYGSNPATMVVGKDAFMKRAELNKAYDGMAAGVVVVDEETGKIESRVGTLKLEGEKIVGGWAEVWRKDREHSTRVEVSFDEYAGRTKDGSLNSQWKSKPGTMIRKVALVQALREAFPGALRGMYSAEEFGMDEPAMTASISQDQAFDNAETAKSEEVVDAVKEAKKAKKEQAKAEQPAPKPQPQQSAPAQAQPVEQPQKAEEEELDFLNMA